MAILLVIFLTCQVNYSEVGQSKLDMVVCAFCAFLWLVELRFLGSSVLLSDAVARLSPCSCDDG